MMLRRLKEDVEKSIAPKEETVVEVSILTITSPAKLNLLGFKIYLNSAVLNTMIHRGQFLVFNVNFFNKSCPSESTLNKLMQFESATEKLAVF